MSLLDTMEPTTAFTLWGYDLRGADVLEMTANIAENGANADLNGYPLWDHPEWLDGEWWRDGAQYEPASWHALPYHPGSVWNRNP
jgi:hypothetical protein